MKRTLAAHRAQRRLISSAARFLLPLALVCCCSLFTSAHAQDPPYLPDLILDPFRGGEADTMMGNLPYSVNDPWGVYSGTAFCHDLCYLPLYCDITGPQNSSYVIQNPVTLALFGTADTDTITIYSGFININWQLVHAPDGGIVGGLSKQFLPLRTGANQTNPQKQQQKATQGGGGVGGGGFTSKRFAAPENQAQGDHRTSFWQNNTGSLSAASGLLTVYATDVQELQPGSKLPWGWLFGTFANEPLEYSAAFGMARLSGKLFARYYSPSDLYTGICYVELRRDQPLGHSQMNWHP